MHYLCNYAQLFNTRCDNTILLILRFSYTLRELINAELIIAEFLLLRISPQNAKINSRN